MCNVCLCPPPMCVYTTHICLDTSFSVSRAVRIDTIPMMNWSSRIWPAENVWIGRDSSPETNPPTDKLNTEDSHRYTISVNSGLSSLQVIGHTLFHWTQLPLGRASVWDRSLVISLPTVHQIISSCTVEGGWVRLHHILTSQQNPSPLSCVLSPLTGSVCFSASQKRGEQGGGYR